MSKRNFLPADFTITNWKAIKPFYEDLSKRSIDSLEDLETFLKDRSELEAVLEEDFAWRYINMNCHTENQDYKASFTDFVTNIQPQLSTWSDKLNNIIVHNVFFPDLPDKPYLTYKRQLKSAVEIFRAENIPLFTKLEQTAQKFGVINGAMSIKHDEKTLTMPAAAQYLERPDRAERAAVYKKIALRRAEDKDELNEILKTLIKDRHQVALNAGFKNFRDYQFKALGRFDYTAADCVQWHEAVKEHLVPLVKTIYQRRAEALNLKQLRPWDLAVDPTNKPPLTPFKTGEELLSKTKRAFARLDPDFKDFLDTMERLGHFDLESRTGKAPGGFNYPLYETGAPFIFMNAVGTQRDLETMVHEGGHAIHSFLSHHWSLNEFKSTPAEVAELASMSMELISMETWDEFYVPDDLNRAFQKKIEDAVLTLPWVAIVDKFQHWLYENPEHSPEERNLRWVEINNEFGSGLIDYSCFEEALAFGWQKQMHIFEVPFYYIEYGFAQMGAISMWKNWQTNREQALKGYKDFMKLGYTETIPEIYEAAGIKFDFSSNYMKDLADFMRPQLDLHL